jgi:hypothetical protein
VSLFSDIIQLFGTSSVPAIVAGSVLGVFELGERFASQRAKDALSKWLLTFAVQKAKALPEGTQELFDRIFGERHFSWKCFYRSATFSLGTMTLIGILCFLINPTKLLGPFTEGVWVWGVFAGIVALWLPWSIIIDYISLFKTRVILTVLARIRFGTGTMVVTMAMLVIDYLFYILIFAIGSLVVAIGNIYFFYVSEEELSYSYMSRLFVELLSESSLIPALDIDAIFFWAGFAPSIWMWLYVAALFVTLGLLRSEKLVTWLRWALDVEKNPFRSIGAVAATLAFIVSVAIILVSAEVSRITSA